MVEHSGIRRRGKEAEKTEKPSDEPSKDWVEEDEQTEEKPVEDVEAEKAEKQQRMAAVNATNGLTLQTALRFMNEGEFVSAAAVLEKLLEQMPEDSKDPACLHNLAVCFERLRDLPKAEEVFWNAATAYENQMKSDKATPEQKNGLEVYKTMYGLASVMTQSHDNCKLLQAEVLLRDILEKSTTRDDMVEDSYRAYALLGEALSSQKKWDLAAQAYEHSVALGKEMFGETEKVKDHRRMLAHAEKLARYQWYVRTFMWVVMIGMICLTIWYAFFRDSAAATEGHTLHGHDAPSGLISTFISWFRMPR